MKTRWFGHSCFYLTSKSGTRILTDPFAESVGYKVPDVEADIVTVSHNHYDHNNIQATKGKFEVFNKEGLYEHKDIQIKGTGMFHDDVNGKKRGANIVFKIKVDGISICHLGDLGHIPDESMVSEIGQVDILLIPVGGTFTIDSSQAKRVVELLKPEVIIPMHYKTPELSFELATVEEFTKLFDSFRIIKTENLEIDIEDLQDYEGNILLMKYK